MKTTKRTQRSLFYEDLDYQWCCPILREPLVDPVVALDGHTYEKSAIQQWIKKSSTSPKTNLPLTSKTLVPNHTLKNMIHDFIPKFLQHFENQLRIKQIQITRLNEQLKRQRATFQEEIKKLNGKITSLQRVLREVIIKSQLKDYTYEDLKLIKEQKLSLINQNIKKVQFKQNQKSDVLQNIKMIQFQQKKCLSMVNLRKMTLEALNNPQNHQLIKADLLKIHKNNQRQAQKSYFNLGNIKTQNWPNLQKWRQYDTLEFLQNQNRNEQTYGICLIGKSIQLTKLIMAANYDHLSVLILEKCNIFDSQWNQLVLYAHRFPALRCLQLGRNKIETIKKGQVEVFKSLNLLLLENNPLKRASIQILKNHQKNNPQFKILLPTTKQKSESLIKTMDSSNVLNQSL